jgi:hypothetical protein
MRYLRKQYDPRVDKLTPQPPICDFCGEHAPEFLYAAGRLTSGEPLPCWRWAACGGCAAKIEAENWQALRAMIAEKLARHLDLPPRVVAASVRAALRMFTRDAIPVEDDGGSPVE